MDGANDFANQIVTNFAVLQLPKKRVLSITKRVIARYLTPLFVKFNESPEIISEPLNLEQKKLQYEELANEIQVSVQRFGKAPADFHGRYAFSHSEEVIIMNF